MADALSCALRIGECAYQTLGPRAGTVVECGPIGTVVDMDKRPARIDASTPTPRRFDDGRQEWLLRGVLHRIGGPAVVRPDGAQEWRVDGKLHRPDGPACSWPDGSREWWLDGALHRTDGPACEFADGSQDWYIAGKLHREDGPARVLADGAQFWFLNGMPHRMDGPAQISADGRQTWWVEGQQVPTEVALAVADVTGDIHIERGLRLVARAGIKWADDARALVQGLLSDATG